MSDPFLGPGSRSGPRLQPARAPFVPGLRRGPPADRGASSGGQGRRREAGRARQVPQNAADLGSGLIP